MTRLYLAGPMTGIPLLNFPLFHAETARLRALGYEVVNPAEINADPNAGWLACMRDDIAALVRCDGVALLPGWEKSRGASLERAIGIGLGLLVVDSLMKCGIGVEDLTGQKDFVDGLCAIARDTGLHIHLVVHMRKGEDEKTAPGKFDVKGAGEITDLVDNLVIVWKNGRKTDDPTSTDPDAYVRVAKQRHHSWEGSFAFWFDKGSQQFKEQERARVTFIDLDLRRAA